MDDKLNAALKGIWDSLTDEQKEQAKGCKTLDELAALAGKEGIELPDEVLDQVGGGCGNSEPKPTKCPACGSTHIRCVDPGSNGILDDWFNEYYRCDSCGNIWKRWVG